jgi:hypothetical protein
MPIHSLPGNRTKFATSPRPAAEPVKRYEFQARIGYSDTILKRSDSLDECCEAIKSAWPRLDKWARCTAYVERPSAIDLGCARGLSQAEQDRVYALLEELFK